MRRQHVKGPEPRSVLDRWSEKVQVGEPDECWPFVGTMDGNGYGLFWIGPRRMPWPERDRAHRIAYRLAHGSIPDGLQIDHICRNRCCVNPAHLQAVTLEENVALGGTRRTHCPKGHTYDETNTYRNPNTGHRACRACLRDYQRRLRAQRRAS